MEAITVETPSQDIHDPIPPDNPNYDLWQRFGRLLTDFAQKFPEDARKIIASDQYTAVITGGVADPNRNMIRRKDIDILFINRDYLMKIMYKMK